MTREQLLSLVHDIKKDGEYIEIQKLYNYLNLQSGITVTLSQFLATHFEQSPTKENQSVSYFVPADRSTITMYSVTQGEEHTFLIDHDLTNSLPYKTAIQVVLSFNPLTDTLTQIYGHTVYPDTLDPKIHPQNTFYFKALRSYLLNVNGMYKTNDLNSIHALDAIHYEPYIKNLYEQLEYLDKAIAFAQYLYNLRKDEIHKYRSRPLLLTFINKLLFDRIYNINTIQSRLADSISQCHVYLDTQHGGNWFEQLTENNFINRTIPALKHRRKWVKKEIQRLEGFIPDDNAPTQTHLNVFTAQCIAYFGVSREVLERDIQKREILDNIPTSMMLLDSLMNKYSDFEYTQS